MSARESHDAAMSHRDLFTAGAATMVAGGVYLATMFPGLAGIGDTPKLQFVGPVLGTPHSPGYPIYIVLSWLFAQLPIGTIAYRINLLSAVCGAIAAGLLALVLRALGCRRVVAFSGALAIAFGQLFWSQALLAEVYTLNAAFFAGVLLFLIRWSRTRAHGDLVVALAFFGAGLAHHLTLAMTGPALLLFALAVDRRVITRRVVIAAALACAVGLSCYGLLWLRTRQAAPFLEVRAQSVGDLVAIVSGRQFHRALWGFTPRELLTVRLPLIATWIGAELRWPGIVLVVIAIVALTRRRPKEIGLLVGCAATVAFFALNYSVYDVQVFLLIPMIALGLIAALGADVLVTQLERMPAGVPVTAIAALLVPAGQYRANIHANNQRHHTFETRYFDALFEGLPDRSAIVSESYPIDYMVRYKLIGEHAAHGRRIELIKADAATIRRYTDNGFTVFAFMTGRSSVEFDGVSFATADLPLPNPSSGRHILDTEALELTYGLSVVTRKTDARSFEPVSIPPEPITGACGSRCRTDVSADVEAIDQSPEIVASDQQATPPSVGLGAVLFVVPK